MKTAETILTEGYLCQLDIQFFQQYFLPENLSESQKHLYKTELVFVKTYDQLQSLHGLNPFEKFWKVKGDWAQIKNLFKGELSDTAILRKIETETENAYNALKTNRKDKLKQNFTDRCKAEIELFDNTKLYLAENEIPIESFTFDYQVNKMVEAKKLNPEQKQEIKEEIANHIEQDYPVGDKNSPMGQYDNDVAIVVKFVDSYNFLEKLKEVYPQSDLIVEELENTFENMHEQFIDQWKQKKDTRAALKEEYSKQVGKHSAYVRGVLNTSIQDPKYWGEKWSFCPFDMIKITGNLKRGKMQLLAIVKRVQTFLEDVFKSNANQYTPEYMDPYHGMPEPFCRKVVNRRKGSQVETVGIAYKRVVKTLEDPILVKYLKPESNPISYKKAGGEVSNETVNVGDNNQPSQGFFKKRDGKPYRDVRCTNVNGLLDENEETAWYDPEKQQWVKRSKETFERVEKEAGVEAMVEQVQPARPQETDYQKLAHLLHVGKTWFPSKRGKQQSEDDLEIKDSKKEVQEDDQSQIQQHPDLISFE